MIKRVWPLIVPPAPSDPPANGQVNGQVNKCEYIKCSSRTHSAALTGEWSSMGSIGSMGQGLSFFSGHDTDLCKLSLCDNTQLRPHSTRDWIP